MFLVLKSCVGQRSVSSLPWCVCHLVLPQASTQGNCTFISNEALNPCVLVQVLCEHTADVFLLLSMDSSEYCISLMKRCYTSWLQVPLKLNIGLQPFLLSLVTFVTIVTLQLFLNECSTDEWFTCCAGLFRDAQHVSIKVLEKMSIVLQRLSKVK